MPSLIIHLITPGALGYSPVHDGIGDGADAVPATAVPADRYRAEPGGRAAVRQLSHHHQQ